MSPPAPLTENAGLAFLGEEAWMPAMLSAREAEKLTASTNACGRPNSDVLRRRLAVVDGAPAESWQIDFPAHFTAQEAALYEQPLASLQKRSGGAWVNPNANPGLRRALARISRFLALPTAAATPDWRWIEEDLLPDATLLVVARDDDFTHGILQSTPFAAWHHAHHTRRQDPEQIVESFPFPWAPATALSALTAKQEEQRHAIARAVRGGNPDQLNAAVLAAYGWPEGTADRELLAHLRTLHSDRLSP